MMSDLAIFLGCTAAIPRIMGIGGLIADHVFPHIPFHSSSSHSGRLSISRSMKGI